MKRKTDKAKEKDTEKGKDKDSEKVKEKDKPVERRSTRRSSRRHSKRRKKSSSPSPDRDESSNEDNVPLKCSVVDSEPTVKTPEKIESGGIQSRLRRSRQKQEVVEASSSKEEKPKDDEWQEDTSFWEETNSKQEESEPKERDRVTRSKAISDAKKLLEQSSPQPKSHRSQRSSRSRNSEKNECVEEENRSLETKEDDNLRNKPDDESSDMIDQVDLPLNDLVSRNKSQSPQPIDNPKSEMVSEVPGNNNESFLHDACEPEEKQNLSEENKGICDDEYSQEKKRHLSEEKDSKEERDLCEEKDSKHERDLCEKQRDSHEDRSVCEEDKESHEEEKEFHVKEQDSFAETTDLQQKDGEVAESYEGVKENNEDVKENNEDVKENNEDVKEKDEDVKEKYEEVKEKYEEVKENYEEVKDSNEEKKDLCENDRDMQTGKDSDGEERNSNAKEIGNLEEGKASCQEIVSGQQTSQIINNETEVLASDISKDEASEDVSEEHASTGNSEKPHMTLDEKLSPKEESEGLGRTSSTPRSENKSEDEKLSVKDDVDYETDEEKPVKGSDSDESEKDGRQNRNREGKQYDRVDKSVSPKYTRKFSESEAKTTQASEHPNRVKLCRKPRESISDVECHEKENDSDSSKLKSEKNCLSSTKGNKERRIKIRRSVSPSRRQNDDEENRKVRKRHSSRSSHSPSPTRRYERVRLKRTGSNYCQEEKENESCEVQTTIQKSESDSKEAEKHTEIEAVVEEPVKSSSRKRRWGASKVCRPVKKPVLSISSDSLKNLIPGAKPLSISEVQLTEDDSPTESKGELDDSWTLEAEKPVERDNYEEIEEKPFVMMPEAPKIVVANTEERGKTPRKISIVSDDARTLQRSPSPPRHKSSEVLYITNLVRPFTVNQLRELLARTGTIVDGGFWIDKIKSKCYVRYETEAEARETRHALHGVRWPVSNPKQLCVDFGKKEDMELAQAMSEADQIPRKTEPLKIEHSVEDWVAEQVREREREHREREKEKERERERVKVKERHAPLEAVEHSRSIKAQTSVREWDLGKVGQMSPPDRDVRQDERSKDRERKVRREKLHRSRSNSPDISARKVRKKEEDAPAKLLDDLFKKTKCTPCIYWLPLTAEQIVVKEEIRRKHMAEHERRLAEMRKAERERERLRMQRQHRRPGSERDKRKRRSTSPSFKK